MGKNDLFKDTQTGKPSSLLIFPQRKPRLVKQIEPVLLSVSYDRSCNKSVCDFSTILIKM